jgi:hypothetical protein
MLIDTDDSSTLGFYDFSLNGEVGTFSESTILNIELEQVSCKEEQVLPFETTKSVIHYFNRGTSSFQSEW